MARPTTSFQKRKRELAKLEKRREKDAKKEQRREEKGSGMPPIEAIDPNDLGLPEEDSFAGIPPELAAYLPKEKKDDEEDDAK